MTAIATVSLNVDAGQAVAALKYLERQTASVNKAANTMAVNFSNSLQTVGSKVTALGQSLQSLAGVAAQIGGTVLVGGFIKAGVEAERTTKKIDALASAYGEASGVNKLATDAANQFGIGQTKAANAVADLYGRLRPMGISLKDIGATFTGVNKAALLMNLSTADTEGVMLQLSQAMGSGALQGDELRSIMERLPAVGQAVANVMGVNVGEIKALGADGKITTDILIKAMQELNQIKPPPPDAYRLFEKALQDLQTTIGTGLLPVFTPLIQQLTQLIAKFQQLKVAQTIAQALAPLGQVLIGLVNGFLQLDSGTQKFIIQLGAIAIALSLIIVPVGLVLSALGTLISAISGVVGVLAGLQILATIAGWLGAVVPVITTVIGALQGFGAVIAAIFTGPVGWITLLVLAVGAIYVFRDKIVSTFQGIVASVSSIFSGLAQIIAAPFEAAANLIKGTMNNVLSIVEGTINYVINAINRLINNVNSLSARLKIPAIPNIPNVQIPRLADGGYIDKPTLAMVGEGRQSEYVIPSNKMQAAMQRYSAGKRGQAVIPQSPSDYAPTSDKSSANTKEFSYPASVGTGNINPQINVTTGPVIDMNGKRYVSQEDLMSTILASTNQAVDQTLQMLRYNTKVRKSVGIA